MQKILQVFRNIKFQKKKKKKKVNFWGINITVRKIFQR